MGNYSFVVLDGSVLKNDVKQQLAKERREEQKRQQEGMHSGQCYLCTAHVFLTRL